METKSKVHQSHTSSTAKRTQNPPKVRRQTTPVPATTEQLNRLAQKFSK